MLQEKSWKNLSNAIHKAFARIVFEDYKAKLLFTDQDQSPVNDLENLSFPQQELSQDQYDQEYIQNTSPEVLQTRSGEQSPTQSHNISQSRHQHSSFHQSAVDASGRPPVHTLSYHPHTSMMNESIAMGHHPEGNQIQQQTSLQRNPNNMTRTDFERDGERTMFGGENIQK